MPLGFRMYRPFRKPLGRHRSRFRRTAQDPPCAFQHLIRVAGSKIPQIGGRVAKAGLDRNFGWSEPTAQRFMRVADAFKTVRATDFHGLTIDASALYLLSCETVPQE